ncbi:hypothetical protein HHK36_015817 [Tetracentron sinense]|uniref:Uncharacterized protein n=1 Tax=Tetracentron sinense TaxID=13715 RepID=A0A834Z5W0_TETSI|nr:hypothetical protein HHK36_015817 [Tetracentron sinense]
MANLLSSKSFLNLFDLFNLLGHLIKIGNLKGRLAWPSSMGSLRVALRRHRDQAEKGGYEAVISSGGRTVTMLCKAFCFFE